MSKGVSGIQIAGITLAEAHKLPIAEMLTFIKHLRESMNAHEFELVSPIITHLSPMLLYLSKIGLRTLSPVITRSGLTIRMLNVREWNCDNPISIIFQNFFIREQFAAAAAALSVVRQMAGDFQ
ncbi:hypothetical protein J2X61_001249 [Bacillus sp. 3255]|nr:hypothetical protein [Bacillus sp. 3255]